MRNDMEYGIRWQGAAALPLRQCAAALRWEGTRGHGSDDAMAIPIVLQATSEQNPYCTIHRGVAMVRCEDPGITIIITRERW